MLSQLLTMFIILKLHAESFVTLQFTKRFQSMLREEIDSSQYTSASYSFQWSTRNFGITDLSHTKYFRYKIHPFFLVLYLYHMPCTTIVISNVKTCDFILYGRIFYVFSSLGTSKAHPNLADGFQIDTHP